MSHSGGSLGSDRTPFYGIKLPPEAKSLIKLCKTVEHATMRQVLKGLLASCKNCELLFIVVGIASWCSGGGIYREWYWREWKTGCSGVQESVTGDCTDYFFRHVCHFVGSPQAAQPKTWGRSCDHGIYRMYGVRDMLQSQYNRTWHRITSCDMILLLLKVFKEDLQLIK